MQSCVPRANSQGATGSLRILMWKADTRGLRMLHYKEFNKIIVIGGRYHMISNL